VKWVRLVNSTGHGWCVFRADVRTWATATVTLVSPLSEVSRSLVLVSMIDHPGFSGYSTLEEEEYQLCSTRSSLDHAGLFAPLSSRTLTETSDFIVSCIPRDSILYYGPCASQPPLLAFVLSRCLNTSFSLPSLLSVHLVSGTPAAGSTSPLGPSYYPNQLSY
jgi:hypothetical protein